MGFVIWIICGLFAAGWMFREEFETHGRVTVGDCLIGAVLFFFGPVVLFFYGLVVAIEWVQENSDNVVLVRKKKTPEDDQELNL